MENQQIRLRANEALKGNWGISLLIIFLCGSITGMVAFFLNTVLSAGTSIFQVFAIMRDQDAVSNPEDLGRLFRMGTIGGMMSLIAQIVLMILHSLIGTYQAYSWQTPVRRQKLEVHSGIQVIKASGVGRVIATSLLVGLFVMLWSLLFIVPGIVKAYSYSQAIYILRDRKDLTPLEAIRESQQMMYGKKGKLFGLELPYLLIPFGVGLIIFMTLITVIVMSQGKQAEEVLSVILMGAFFVLFVIILYLIIGLFIQVKIGYLRAAFYESVIEYHGLKPGMTYVDPAVAPVSDRPSGTW